MTQLKPALISLDDKFIINPQTKEDQIHIDYIPIADLISRDANQIMTLGSDGKLLTVGEITVTCTFNVTDLLSADANNIIGISTNDGKLFADQCILQVADWLSTDANNGLGLGKDGKFWFDNTLDCEINIANLLSQQSGNDIQLSLIDGKLFATIGDAECEINIGSLRSDRVDNLLTIDTVNGRLYVRPYDCQFNLADFISVTHKMNKLKIHTVGDGRMYVDVADFVSKDTNSGIILGTDGGIKFDWSLLMSKLWGADNFKFHLGHLLPVGGTWAYICIQPYGDGDLPGYDTSALHLGNYLQGVNGVGIGAGGTAIPNASNPGIYFEGTLIKPFSIVWRID